MRVLITGGTGFIGQHIARRLVTDGDEVVVLSRRSTITVPACRTLPWSGISDVKGVRRAIAGVDAVVHLAARVHVMQERARDALAAFREVNVAGTEMMLRESIDAGVRTFVYFSSIKAAAERSTTPLDEKIEARPEDAYGMSKREAELRVQELATSASLAGVVIRPPLVYGPLMKGNMLRLFRLVSAGAPLPFSSIENARSVAFSGNVAWAVSSLLRTPLGRDVEIFNVADEEAPSTPELVRRVGDALQRPAHLFSVPQVFLAGVGAIGDLMSPLVRWGVTSAEIERLTGSLVLDISRLRRRIGRPPHTLQDGLRETARWFRDASAAA